MKKVFVIFLAFFLQHFASAQTPYNCSDYNDYFIIKHLRKEDREVYMGGGSDYINKLENFDTTKYYFLDYIVKHVMPDTCKCFITYRDGLRKIEARHRSLDFIVFDDTVKNKRLLIELETKKVNIPNQYPAIYKSYKEKDYYTYEQDIDYVHNVGELKDSARVITKFNIKLGRDSIPIEAKLFQSFLDPDFDYYDFYSACMPVSAYLSKDSRFLYVYFSGAKKESPNGEDGLPYLGKFVIDLIDKKVRCRFFASRRILRDYYVRCGYLYGF